MNFKFGEEITFGKYFFDNQHEKKDLVWIMISEKSNKILLLTKYIMQKLMIILSHGNYRHIYKSALNQNRQDPI